MDHNVPVEVGDNTPESTLSFHPWVQWMELRSSGPFTGAISLALEILIDGCVCNLYSALMKKRGFKSFLEVQNKIKANFWIYVAGSGFVDNQN